MYVDRHCSGLGPHPDLSSCSANIGEVYFLCTCWKYYYISVGRRGNNDDDSTVKPIQQDISNCKCLYVEREKRERRYAKAFSMREREREIFQT